MAKNPICGSNKSSGPKDMHVPTKDAAMIGGIVNGLPLTKTAPKKGQG